MKDCKHQNIDYKKIKCIDCNKQFNTLKMNCQSKNCKNKTVIIVDENNEIMNPQLFYVCKQHAKEVNEAFKDFEAFAKENEKDLQELLEEQLQKHINKVKH